MGGDGCGRSANARLVHNAGEDAKERLSNEAMTGCSSSGSGSGNQNRSRRCPVRRCVGRRSRPCFSYSATLFPPLVAVQLLLRANLPSLRVSSILTLVLPQSQPACSKRRWQPRPLSCIFVRRPGSCSCRRFGLAVSVSALGVNGDGEVWTWSLGNGRTWEMWMDRNAAGVRRKRKIGLTPNTRRDEEANT